MKRKLNIVMAIIVIIIVAMFCEYRLIMTHQQLEYDKNGMIQSTVFGITDTYNAEKPGMTVDDVVSIASTDYFIVKDIDTWAVLESDVYMDREVVEIAICDDAEDTLCLFIKLNENEEPHIRGVTS